MRIQFNERELRLLVKTLNEAIEKATDDNIVELVELRDQLNIRLNDSEPRR